jgi:K+-sensing histidine kinase KdpD
MDSSEELRQTRLAYRMMGYLHQFKAGFLARTSHELRSPLGSLMGLHQLILADLCENPAEEREFIAQAYQAADKLMKILDEILKVSKITYGSIPLEIQPIQLGQLLEELYQLTHLQAINKSLYLQFATITPVYILADSSHLLEILLMLVDTTIKLQSEGIIKLNTEVKDDLIAIILESELSRNIWNQSQNLTSFTPETTLEDVKNFSQNLEVSPGMKLVLARTLLEVMQGSLIIQENSSGKAQIKCLLPLVNGKGV